MFIAHLKDGRSIKENEVINGVVHDWKVIKQVSNNLSDISSFEIVRTDPETKKKTFHACSVSGTNVDLIQLKANVLDMIQGTDKLVERVQGFIIKDDNGKPLYAVKLRIGEKTGGTVLTLDKMTEKGWVSQ